MVVDSALGLTGASRRVYATTVELALRERCTGRAESPLRCDMPRWWLRALERQQQAGPTTVIFAAFSEILAAGLVGRPFFLKGATNLEVSAPGNASRDPESSNSHAFNKANTPSSYYREALAGKIWTVQIRRTINAKAIFAAGAQASVMSGHQPMAATRSCQSRDGGLWHRYDGAPDGGAILWTAAQRRNDTEQEGISRNNQGGQRFSEFLSAASGTNLWP
jgi:hypothetical protein